MPKLYIMKGLPASGKTTYCRTKLAHCVRVNRDSLRWMIYGSAWNPKREYEITLAEEGLASWNLSGGRDVVIDATNLHPKSFKRWEALASGYEATLEVIDFTDVPPWVCVENDHKRPQHEQVGSSVIWEKWYKYLAPEPYKFTTPCVIISDLDGTVRDNSWRDAYDLTGKCIDDPVRWQVLSALKGIQNPAKTWHKDTKILFFSGMEGTEANISATTEWLNRTFSPEEYELYMRTPGDSRRDSLVKKEMFEKHVVARNYGVDAVFDDRPQVIRECWVPLGLYDRIFSVGKPELEF